MSLDGDTKQFLDHFCKKCLKLIGFTFDGRDCLKAIDCKLVLLAGILKHKKSGVLGVSLQKASWLVVVESITIKVNRKALIIQNMSSNR